MSSKSISMALVAVGVLVVVLGTEGGFVGSRWTRRSSERPLCWFESEVRGLARR
jgi:hypothetical protein